MEVFRFLFRRRFHTRIALLAGWLWMLVSTAYSVCGPEWDSAIVAMVQKARRAVVNIEARSPISKKLGPLSDILHKADRTGESAPDQRRWYTLVASGIIWNEHGYVVTTASVVRDAEKIRVNTFDRGSFEAKLVGLDDESNLAVLHIPVSAESVLPTIPRRKEQLPEGSFLILLGYGFGGVPSIASGIAGMPPELFDPSRTWFQFTAPVRPGNSGSALIDSKGNLAGIVLGREEDVGFRAVLKLLTQQKHIGQANTSSLSNSGVAVSATTAEPIISSLIRHGQVVRGWMGVAVRRCPQIGERGLEVVRIVKNSPADHAGLRRGDRLIRFGETVLTDPEQLGRLVRESRPGTAVIVAYMRDGALSSARVDIAEKPHRRRIFKGFSLRDSAPSPDNLGVSLQDLTPSLKRHFHVPDNLGVMISDVTSSTYAYRTGLRAGDILIALDDTEVRRSKDAAVYLAKHRFGDRVEWTVMRDGKKQSFTLILTLETAVSSRLSDQVKFLETDVDN